MQDANLQCIISIKKTLPYFEKKKHSFFSFLFFMQSFNFCQLLVQIFYLFQYIIQKKAFLKEATIISSWTALVTGSSHRRCSLWKGVLRNFAKLTEKHLRQSLFLNKVANLSLQLYLKKRLCHRCFPADFAKFLRTTFLQNTTAPQLLYGPCIIFTT